LALAPLGFKIDTAAVAKAVADLDGLTSATSKAETVTKSLTVNFNIAVSVVNNMAAATERARAANDNAAKAASRHAAAISQLTAAEARYSAAAHVARADDVAAYGAELDRLRVKFNPLYAEVARYRAVLGEIRQAHAVGAISSNEMAAAITRERQATLQSIAALKGRKAAISEVAAAQRTFILAATDDMARFRRQNLGYQLMDIGQMTALGQNPAMMLMQQGPQVAQLYAMQGGLNALWRDATAILGGLVRVAGPWIAAAGAMYGAYKLIASYGREAQLAVSATTAALAAQAEPLDSVRGKIDELQRLTDAYAKAIRGTAKDQSLASASIIANTEAEFNAKKSLLELELKRQKAAIEAQKAELAIAGIGLKRDVGGSVGDWTSGFLGGPNGVQTRMDLERQGFADPRVGSVPFVRLPDDITGLDRTREVLENSPLSDRVKELRSNITLTEIATKSLEDALKVTFAESVKTSEGRIAKGGKSEAERLAKRYQDIVRDANQATEAFKRQTGALFLSDEAAAQLERQAELLNKAQDAGIKLTAKQTAELMGLGSAMAAAEIAYKKTKEALDFAKSTVKGFVSDLRSGLEQGKSFWESFGQAALNVLDKIVDKLLNDVVDALFQVNSAGGGSSGGIGGLIAKGLSWLFGGGSTAPRVGVGLYHSGGVVGQSTAMRMADPSIFLNAPRFHNGGIAGDEIPAILRRGEIVSRDMNHLRQQAGDANSPAAANSNVSIRLIMPEGWRAELVGEARDGARQDTVQIVEDYDRRMPDRVQAIQQHPRRR